MALVAHRTTQTTQTIELSGYSRYLIIAGWNANEDAASVSGGTNLELIGRYSPISNGSYLKIYTATGGTITIPDYVGSGPTRIRNVVVFGVY